MIKNTNAPPHVTVIVPVYNTPNPLMKKCIDSILAQTFGNFDIIIVNDGSGTSTSAFLTGLEELDQRIKVINQPNSGVSAARNTGIKAARGAYLAFVDADDTITSCFLSRAFELAKATKADAVFGGISLEGDRNVAGYRTESNDGFPNILISRDCFNDVRAQILRFNPPIQNISCITNVVAALYKSDVAKQITFPEAIAHSEDRIFNFRFLDLANSIYCVSEVWYRYNRQNTDSVTNRFSKKSSTQFLSTMNAIAELTNKKECDKRISESAADGIIGYLNMLCAASTIGRSPAKAHYLVRGALSSPSVTNIIDPYRPTKMYDRYFIFLVRKRMVWGLILISSLQRILRGMRNRFT